MTPKKKAAEPKKAPAKAVAPVEVTAQAARSDDDGVIGSFVDVVAGDHEGRRGTYIETASSDPKTGYPATVIVRTRDARQELLTVDYADVRPAKEYFGGR